MNFYLIGIIVLLGFVVSSNTLACANTNITHPLNGTNPVMIASAGTNEPNSVLVDATYRCSIAVGNKCLDTSQIALAGVQLSKLPELRLPLPMCNIIRWPRVVLPDVHSFCDTFVF